MHLTRHHAATLFCAFAWLPALCAQTSRSLVQANDVSVTVHLLHSPGNPSQRSRAGAQSSANVVVWLTPLRPADPVPELRPQTPSSLNQFAPTQFALTQKNRQFSPHLLVVPAGSTVAFPNLDPFFHNVFSLFNGKRFDLGLYEANSRRSVRFDRPGVSYIFCNIHPEMGAVVIALSTPFFAVSGPSGDVVIHGVPSGSYRLSLWAENVPPARLAAAERTLEIGPAHLQLPPIELETASGRVLQHKNKFDEPYGPPNKDPY